LQAEKSHLVSLPPEGVLKMELARGMVVPVLDDSTLPRSQNGCSASNAHLIGAAGLFGRAPW